MSRADPADQALQRLALRRYKTRCESQERMIERADSLRELARLALLTVPADLYIATEARDAQRVVALAAENRAKTLIMDQIEYWLKAEPEYREKYRAKMIDDWASLVGSLAHLKIWAMRQFTAADQNKLQ